MAKNQAGEGDRDPGWGGGETNIERDRDPERGDRDSGRGADIGWGHRPRERGSQSPRMSVIKGSGSVQVPMPLGETLPLCPEDKAKDGSHRVLWDIIPLISLSSTWPHRSSSLTTPLKRPSLQIYKPEVCRAPSSSGHLQSSKSLP